MELFSLVFLVVNIIGATKSFFEGETGWCVAFSMGAAACVSSLIH